MKVISVVEALGTRDGPEENNRETREMGQVMIKTSNHSCGQRRSFKEVGEGRWCFCEGQR